MNDHICQQIENSAHYRELVEKRQRFAFILSIIMLIIYVGFILLIAFAPHWLGTPLHEGTSVGIPSLSQAENFLSACYNLGFDDDEAFGLWRTTWFVISSELQWNGEARVRRGDHMPAPEFTDADMDAHPSAARVFGNGNRCPRDTASSPTSPRSSTAPSPTRAPQFRPPPARRFARRRRGRSTGRRKWRRPEETGQPIAC